jgi:hypothetical protein
MMTGGVEVKGDEPFRGLARRVNGWYNDLKNRQEVYLLLQGYVTMVALKG